jgi:hypothetical protein
LVKAEIEAAQREVRRAESVVTDQLALIADLRQKKRDFTMGEYFLGVHQRALKIATAHLGSLVHERSREGSYAAEARSE